MRVAAFSAGFLLIASTLMRALPPIHTFEVTPKLHHLEQHRGEFDVLFFGSSRVLRHFMANEFDAQLAAAGHPMHSFNFGIDAMPPPESFFVIRQALALRPGARWIFIELWDIRSVAAASSLEMKRFIHWHDPRHTVLVLRRLFGDRRVATGEKIERACIHLRAALTRCSQIGRGSEWLATVLPPPEPDTIYEEPIPWLDHAGFSPGPGEPMTGAAREKFERSVRAIRDSFPTSALPVLLRHEAAQLAREIRATGAEPVFIAMPSVNGGENYADPRTQGIDAAFLSLVSPARFPELYDPARHHDVWHLTEPGARDFTRDLASEFQTLLESHGEPAGRK